MWRVGVPCDPESGAVVPKAEGDTRGLEELRGGEGGVAAQLGKALSVTNRGGSDRAAFRIDCNADGEHEVSFDEG